VEQAYRLGVPPDRLAKEIVDRGQLGVAVTEVLRAKALDLLAERAAVTDEAGNPVDVKAIAAEAKGEAEPGDDAESGDDAEAGADAEAAEGAETVSEAGPADAGAEDADGGAEAAEDEPAQAGAAKARKRAKAAK
jgi:trigger factor